MLVPLLGAFLFISVSLPMGGTPDPVDIPHFPDTLHAFVWRNWSLVPLDRMAETVETTPDKILEIGVSMGLPEPESISREQWQRSYITIIRRNWHLLPYDQLLTLLGWSEEKMAFTLKEDDFLFHKLGSLKPSCPHLAYHAPGASSRERSHRIAEILHDLPEPGRRDQLFSFVGKLSSPPEKGAHRFSGTRFAPRFCSSYFATYGDPLLKEEPDPFPDGYLARLADSGVDGVWLQAVLYKLTPFPWESGLSARHQERLERLRELVTRARKHNIGIYLYLNEPRSMPLSFFSGRENLLGVKENDQGTLCVSNPEVRNYLVESIAHVCREVPGLAGFFTITGSENLTNCWSHYHGEECPLCGKRGPEEVISDVNRAIREGIDAAGSDARLIAWDWGWKDEWAPGIISALPQEIALMSVSEWSIPISRGGIRTSVGEYSISVVGPGPRALRHWSLAAGRGHETLAKIQTNNTWELSPVPYIPAVANVARHIANLREKRVNGLMLGWTLGGHPSPNLEVVAELGGKEDLTAEEALLAVAARRYGEAAAPLVVTAWELFSSSFSEFPYHGGTVYHAPLQMGPANLLYAGDTGYTSTMVGFPYDDLEGWCSVYPPGIFIQQMNKVAGGFLEGLEILRSAGKVPASPEQQRLLEEEIRIAEVCAIHFQSVANQSRFVLDRKALGETDDPAETLQLASSLKKILESEIELASRLRFLQLEDARFGFEASNHYFYVPQDLAEKVLNCRWLLSEWIPSLEGGLEKH